MKPESFEAFAIAAKEQGFDEVVERTWAPLTVLDTHTHEFSVKAVVVEGEMWLTMPGAQELHLRAGDEFALDRAVPHSERYGPAGATYWVARQG